MEMQLYKRIPKNWWQKVWFRLRPQIVEVKMIANGNITPKPSNYYAEIYKNGKWIETLSPYWFEANYEPVNNPNFMPIKPPTHILCAELQDPNSWDCKPYNDAVEMVKPYERDCPPNIKLTWEEEYELMRQHIRASESGL